MNPPTRQDDFIVSTIRTISQRVNISYAVAAVSTNLFDTIESCNSNFNNPSRQLKLRQWKYRPIAAIQVIRQASTPSQANKLASTVHMYLQSTTNFNLVETFSEMFPSACFPCHDAYTAPDKYILDFGTN